jgi:hypothetical protein
MHCSFANQTGDRRATFSLIDSRNDASGPIKWATDRSPAESHHRPDFTFTTIRTRSASRRQHGTVCIASSLWKTHCRPGTLRLTDCRCCGRCLTPGELQMSMEHAPRVMWSERLYLGKRRPCCFASQAWRLASIDRGVASRSEALTN